MFPVNLWQIFKHQALIKRCNLQHKLLSNLTHLANLNIFIILFYLNFIWGYQAPFLAIESYSWTTGNVQQRTRVVVRCGSPPTAGAQTKQHREQKQAGDDAECDDQHQLLTLRPVRGASGSCRPWPNNSRLRKPPHSTQHRSHDTSHCVGRGHRTGTSWENTSKIQTQLSTSSAGARFKNPPQIVQTVMTCCFDPRKGLSEKREKKHYFHSNKT